MRRDKKKSVTPPPRGRSGPAGPTQGSPRVPAYDPDSEDAQFYGYVCLVQFFSSIVVAVLFGLALYNACYYPSQESCFLLEIMYQVCAAQSTLCMINEAHIMKYVKDKEKNINAAKNKKD